MRFYGRERKTEGGKEKEREWERERGWLTSNSLNKKLEAAAVRQNINSCVFNFLYALPSYKL